ncbi:MAG: hypothetical protein RIM99_17355 [Cyclobacteriaceae bacterium]
MKIKHYLPILALIFLASCSEDDNKDGGLTADEAKDQINAIADNLGNDVVTMVQSEGVEGALDLVDLLDNSTVFGRISPYQTDANKQFFTQQSSKLAHYFTNGVAQLLGEEPVDFTEKKDIYEWDPTIGDFVPQHAEVDFVEIRFPVEESTTNNGVFRLEKFEVVEIDGEELPTAIEANLTIDGGDPVIDLSFVVNYDSNGNPELADIYLAVLPFALDVSFNNTNASSTSLDASLLLEGENLLGIDVTVEFDSDEKLEPVSISGEVSYRNLRIVGNANLTFDINVDDPNEFFDLALFIGFDKAGDIVFIEDVAHVEYADGSVEILEEILASVITEIEETFTEIGID